MKCTPTKLAVEIITKNYAQSRDAFFIAVQDAGPRLSFGANRTQAVQYRIHLQNEDQEFVLTSNHQQQFALLADADGPNGTPRIVLYMGEDPDPALEHVHSDDGNNSLFGYILILAHEEQGPGSAIIHAIFDGDRGASLLIDGADVLQHHLTLCTSLIEREN